MAREKAGREKAGYEVTLRTSSRITARGFQRWESFFSAPQQWQSDLTGSGEPCERASYPLKSPSMPIKCVERVPIQKEPLKKGPFSVN